MRDVYPGVVEGISEQERQRLLDQYEELRASGASDPRESSRRTTFGLVALGVVGFGAVLGALTNSWLLASIAMLGAPVIGFGATLVATVAREMHVREKRPEARILLEHDTQTQRIALPEGAEGLEGFRLLAALFDFTVTRWGVQYGPDDHGGRFVVRVRMLATEALRQLDAGMAPRLDSDWSVVPTLEAPDLTITLNLGELDGVTQITSHWEPMIGLVDKGRLCTDACLALIADALETPPTGEARRLANLLLVQCDAFQKKGSRTQRGDSLRPLAA